MKYITLIVSTIGTFCGVVLLIGAVIEGVNIYPDFPDGKMAYAMVVLIVNSIVFAVSLAIIKSDV